MCRRTVGVVCISVFVSHPEVELGYFQQLAKQGGGGCHVYDSVQLHTAECWCVVVVLYEASCPVLLLYIYHGNFGSADDLCLCHGGSDQFVRHFVGDGGGTHVLADICVPI